MRRRPDSGVTLLELLIAVSLVSLISVGILMAMRVGLNAMEKTNARLMDNRRVLGVERVIEQQVAHLMAVAADCRSRPEDPPFRTLFFQGAPQTMRFVSAYSLQEALRGYPRILEYQVVPLEDGSGVRLVVNEQLYWGPASTGALCLGPHPEAPGIRFRPVVAGPRSFVLADRLAYCRFAYLERLPPPAPPRWVAAWAHPVLPAAIRIEMARREPDPARLPLLTVTLPVRVNKDPRLFYADEYYLGQ
jgi:prepilin-type N-terminal cleavage/methylation domain-containing protein